MIYYANADSYERVPQDDIYNVDFYMVAGSMCGLHSLADSITNPKSITILDIEEDMTLFARAYIDLIMASETIVDFFRNYFCREFGYDIRDVVETPPDFRPVHDCMLPVHKHAALLRTAKPVGNRATRCTDPRPLKCLEIKTGKKFWGIEEMDAFKTYIGMAPDGAYDPMYINSFYPGCGFHTEWGYQKVRENLLSVPVTVVKANAFTYPYKPGGYVYMSGVIKDLLPWKAIEIARLMQKDIVLRDSGIVIEDGESYWIPESRIKFEDERSVYYGLQR